MKIKAREKCVRSIRYEVLNGGARKMTRWT